MSKKHVFLQFFSKITIFACVFCTFFVLPVFATLPDGYIELEYIESTGTQYIDTGYIANANSYAEIIFSPTVSGTSSSGPFGSYVGTRFQVFNDGTQAVSLGIGNKNSGTDFKSSNYNQAGIIYTAILDVPNSFASVNGVASTNIAGATFGSNTTSALLFAVRQTNILYSKSKIYSVVIKEQGIDKHIYVPAMKNNVLGMYDSVSGQFLTNAGTGSFIAGPISCAGGQKKYISATGTVAQNGTPTPTNPIEPTFYTQGVMTLRAVGNYVDSYDSTTRKITRNVGVKVLDGTENWFATSSGSGNYLGSMYNLVISDMFTEASSVTSGRISPYCTHFERSSNWITNSATARLNKIQAYAAGSSKIVGLGYPNASDGNLPAFKQWLAQQYNQGTPVVIYYPLVTPVVENVEDLTCYPPVAEIKIATTNFVETEFAPLEARLSSTIATVDNVVTQTIAQATAIGELQNTKQTRPSDDNECPANMKCLLVTDESGTPHWYPIIEP